MKLAMGMYQYGSRMKTKWQGRHGSKHGQGGQQQPLFSDEEELKDSELDLLHEQPLHHSAMRHNHSPSDSSTTNHYVVHF